MALHGIIGREQLLGEGTAFGKGVPDPNPFPKGTKLKLFCGSVANPGDCATAEDLLTKSLHGGGVLKDKGDIVVLDREGSFDRKGDYHVYLYYAEMVEPEKKDGADKKDSGEAGRDTESDQR